MLRKFKFKILTFKMKLKIVSLSFLNFFLLKLIFLLENRLLRFGASLYGKKSVDRIGTQSMSKICNLWRLIVVDCDYAESYGRFLSGRNADASHAVYIVPDDS